MKICKKCKQIKELDLFYKCWDKPDGHAYICKKCDNERNSIRRKQPKEKIKRKNYFLKYTIKNKEKLSSYYKNYFLTHKEIYKSRNKQWTALNSERAKELGRKNFQKKSRKDKHKANQAMRRAIKLHATFPGYNEEIKKIYLNCPIGYHVDHIIPLRGKLVCGLHVPWNLQYLPAIENIKKGNKVIL